MRELKKELKYWENYRKEVLNSGMPQFIKQQHLADIEYQIVRVISNMDDFDKQERNKKIIIGSIAAIALTIILLILFI
jgi:hypothetical protein